MDVRQGTRLDRYVVEGLVGAGGMARVVRVRHVQLGSLHAVKVLHLPTPAIIDRLMKEGRAQSALRHPNIVAVTDVIDVGGAPGLVMEWVGGPSLAGLLKARRLTLAEVDALARGLFAGIAAAHDAGWVHRDLKPANVLLARIDDALVPKVADFGLVKALATPLSDSEGPRTRTGAMLGTPAYMAPEQTLDAGAVDHRADVFSLGAMLYEALAGRRPFDGGDVFTLVAQAREGAAPPLATLRPDVPPGWAEGVQACLAPDPGDRPASVRDLAARWVAAAASSPGWSAATLTTADGLVPPVQALAVDDAGGTTLSVGSDDTFGSFGGGTALEAPASVVHLQPERPPEVPPARARGAMGLGLALVVVLVGLGGWAATRRPASGPPAGPQVLTVAGVPDLGGTPVQAEQLAQGWRALLDGDADEAVRRLTVAEGIDDPLPALLRAYALLRAGQLEASLQATTAVRARWQATADGPTGSLLRVVAAQQDQGAIDVPERAAHRAAFPEDLLGRLMEADYCGMVALADCERAVPALLARAPRAALAHQVAAEAWEEAGARDRSLAAVDAGLRVVPLDPTLLHMRAEALLASGDVAAAGEALDALDAASPGGARALRTRHAVLAGHEAPLAALKAERTSASQPLEVRLGWYQTAADTLEGLGRFAAADALLQEAQSVAADAPDRVYLLLLDRVRVARWAGCHDDASARLQEAALLAARSPEVPNAQRNRLTGAALLDELQVAVCAKDVPAVQALAVRIEASASLSPDVRETAARELAVVTGDAAAIPSLGATLWWGEGQRGFVLGDALRRAGDPAAARPFLEAAAGPASARHTRQRAWAAAATVGLAEGFVAEGRLEDAREAAVAARTLWPGADPTSPVAARLAAVEAELAR